MLIISYFFCGPPKVSLESTVCNQLYVRIFGDYSILKNVNEHQEKYISSFIISITILQLQSDCLPFSWTLM